MVFRQLSEPLSNTYTYLFGCEETGRAVLVDPVYPTWERDLQVLSDLGLTLALTVETHVHADHITSARKLRETVGSKMAFPAPSRVPVADIAVEEGRPLQVGSIRLDPLFTPGHTDDHFSYRSGDRVMTGDALLIDGCGRTDFQNGDAPTLYASVRDKLFALPGETLVYPAHDYNDRFVSNIAQEKARNPRLGGERSLEEFVKTMRELDLDYPKFIDFAVPGNRKGGECPADLPEKLQKYCDEMTMSRQG